MTQKFRKSMETLSPRDESDFQSFAKIKLSLYYS